jgi:hypothetical protein
MLQPFWYTQFMKIFSHTATTSATAQAIWPLFADVHLRKQWDDAIDTISIDAPFGVGATGTIQLKGQPPRKFVILDAKEPFTYTDRFLLPLKGKMDWKHTIIDDGDSRSISFDIAVHGPTTFLLGPIMKLVLKKELPATIHKLAQIAENTRG